MSVWWWGAVRVIIPNYLPHMHNENALLPTTVKLSCKLLKHMLAHCRVAFWYIMCADWSNYLGSGWNRFSCMCECVCMCVLVKEREREREFLMRVSVSFVCVRAFQWSMCGKINQVWEHFISAWQNTQERMRGEKWQLWSWECLSCALACKTSVLESCSVESENVSVVCMKVISWLVWEGFTNVCKGASVVNESVSVVWVWDDIRGECGNMTAVSGSVSLACVRVFQ